MAIALPLAYVFVMYVLQMPYGAAYTAFGTFALLAMADFGGPTKDRALAYIFTGVAGLVTITLGTFMVLNPWVAIVGTFVVAVGVMFAGVLRGYVGAAGLSVLLPFVIAVTSDPAVGQLPQRLIGFVVAVCFSLAAALLLWPVHTRSALRLRVAEMLRAASKAVEALWPEASPPGSPAATGAVDLEARMRELTEASNRLHQAYDGRLLRPGGATARDRALMLLIDETNRLRIALRWRPESDELLLPSDHVLAQVTAQTLASCAEAIGHNGPPPDPTALDVARDEHRLTVEAWASRELQTGTAEKVQAALEAGFHVRLIAITTELCARYTRIAVGAPAAASAITTAGAEMPDFEPSPWKIMLSQLRFTSPWFRNSLKAGLALLIAVGIVDLSREYASDYAWSSSVTEHGFWVVLGTLTALRSDALGTARTAVVAIAGTTAGFLIGSGLILLLGITGHDQLILWILLPVVTFLAAYTPGAISLMVGQASFTIFVIAFYALVTGLDLQTGELRVLDVGIGLAISLLVSALMWPRGVIARVNKSLIEAMQASSAALVASYDRLLVGPVADDAAHASLMAAYKAVHNADETYDLAIAQGGPATINSSAWSCVSSSASAVLASAQLVTFMARIGLVPVGCPSAGDIMISCAHHVQARLNDAVRNLNTQSSPDRDDETSQIVNADISPVAFERTADDPFPRLRASITGCMASWEGKAPDPNVNVGASALLLVWAEDWLVQINWVAERTAAVGGAQQRALETSSAA